MRRRDEIGILVRIAVEPVTEAIAPSNGRTPVSISCSSTPSDQMSLAVIDRGPADCSGLMYGSVPNRASRAGDQSSIVAMPKSRTFTVPSRSTMMFDGLMSRCTTPRAWRAADAARDLHGDRERPLRTAAGLASIATGRSRRRTAASRGTAVHRRFRRSREWCRCSDDRARLPHAPRRETVPSAAAWLPRCGGRNFNAT